MYLLSQIQISLLAVVCMEDVGGVVIVARHLLFNLSISVSDMQVSLLLPRPAALGALHQWKRPHQFGTLFGLRGILPTESLGREV